MSLCDTYCNQIDTYQLSTTLHPAKRLWESIRIQRRGLRFVIANGWLALCPLICEDLARQDPVSTVVRSLGPTLVVALLFDGPQLKERWPARYATVLADDPGSSVLTLTSLGMALRSRPSGKEGQPVIALWRDARTGTHEVRLDKNGGAVLITLCAEYVTEFTADGRSDDATAARLVLSEVQQLA